MTTLLETARRPLPCLLAAFVLGPAPPSAADCLPLRQGWAIQSSSRVEQGGDAVSRPGFPTVGWHAARVPSTVVGALVEAGIYADPYFGMNLRKIPGTTYPIGARFTLLPMPADSPFRPAWWYRREFTLPAALRGRTVWLRFDGINYRAEVWLNGARVAGPDEVAGAFRRYEFDVTALARVGEANAVAVAVTPPELHDLAITWVDWNPTPADKNMGLWGEVVLADSGPIALRHPHVVTSLELPSLASADLAVSVEAVNATDAPVSALVRGAIEGVPFSRPVALGPRERKRVRFTSAEVPGLRLLHPRVWWPYRMGAPELYTLALEVEVAGLLSDRQEVRFGVVRFDSERTAEGHRLFRVNGKRILIRGGGWASDLMLRPASPARLEAEMRYVREMGLNTLRLEGKLESDLFYDLADRHGILVMPGWCCCDQWEKWDQWDAEDHRVAPASLRDQILRLRNHPSVLVWLNGSDNPPPAPVEKAYLDVLADLEWSKPVLSNATDQPGALSGPSGVKMRGPYDYVPPNYWLADTRNGGAFGFATEVGPGGAVPPIEGLKRILPADRLWPINEYWLFHAGSDPFRDLTRFTAALEARYGAAAGAEDYARKAQTLAYEGERAMFEAYARNKYAATGVIQWMLNNAWPSLIWHLYDNDLRPGGGYYGAKKACEPLHVQFSYDDRSVVVVNDTPQAFAGLQVSAQLLDLGLATRFSKTARVEVGPDGVVRAFAVGKPEDLTPASFLQLGLADSAGRSVSSNFYWLSTREDVLDWEKTEWYTTPTKRHADLTALAKLPKTTLALEARLGGTAAEGRVRVRVANTGRTLAFQVHLKLVEAESGEELLPVYWEDNYLALRPGETRGLAVSFPRDRPARARVEADAWNAARVVAVARP